jgi:glucose-1-phosphate adenylyltransferase
MRPASRLARKSIKERLVSGGSIISGAVVRESLLFSNVRVDEGSSLHRAVVMPSVRIGKGCTIQNAIIDEHCDIPDGMQIGVDLELDRSRFDVTPKGVVLVTPDHLAKVSVATA